MIFYFTLGCAVVPTLMCLPPNISINKQLSHVPYLDQPVAPTKNHYPALPSSSLVKLALARRFVVYFGYPHPSMGLVVDSVVGPANTGQYIVYDSELLEAVVIDCALDFNLSNGRTDASSIEDLVSRIHNKGLTVQMILETHCHADHISGAQVLREKLGKQAIPVAIGRQITVVQETFKSLFELAELDTDGRQFDRLLDEGDTFHVGKFTFRVISTPGHTPACSTYICDEAKVAFCGDTIFASDYGTARCDFPKGSPHTLYASIQKLLAEIDGYEVYFGHDYPENLNRPFKFSENATHIRMANKHVNCEVSEEQFVKFRTEKDKTLQVPKLLIPSLQCNLIAGRLPKFIKLPVNLL